MYPAAALIRASGTKQLTKDEFWALYWELDGRNVKCHPVIRAEAQASAWQVLAAS